MKKHFLRIFSLLTLCAMLIGLTACGEERVPASGMQFKAVLAAEPKSLDPQVATDNAAVAVMSNLFEGLTRLDASGRLLPGVAVHWETDSANTEYTFTLRDDACWNDGTPVTAQDFIFGWLRALDPDIHAPNAAQLFIIAGAEAYHNGEGTADQVGLSAPNATTLRVKLTAPDDYFLQLCATPICMPCNEFFFRRTAGAYGMSAENTLCNGPYCFRAKNGWLEGDYLYLTRNKQYHGDQPADAGSIFLTRKSVTDVPDALEKGNLHIAEIAPEEKEAAEAVEAFDITVHSYGVQTDGVFFNTADPLFASEKVRTLMLCTVQPEVFDGMKMPGQKRTGTVIPSATVWDGEAYRAQAADCRPLPYDEAVTAAQMKQALAESGQNAMVGVTVLCADTPQSRQVVNALITAWYRAFGYYINIEPVSEKDYALRIRSGEFQIAFGGITVGNNDPISFLRAVCTAAKYEPERMDSHLNSRTQNLMHARLAEKQLISEGVFYPIFESERCWAMRSEIVGLELNPFNGAFYYRSAKR